jgi:hypothetical protein
MARLKTDTASGRAAASPAAVSPATAAAGSERGGGVVALGGSFNALIATPRPAMGQRAEVRRLA